MDMLKFAVEMELEGERYYRRQAEENRDNGLAIVFRALADDEHRHAKLLEGALGGLPHEPDAVPNSYLNVFERAADFKSAVNHKQLDAYRAALEKEEASIALYTKLRDQTQRDRTLFEFLIAEEEKHYQVMDLLVRLVVRPEEWVESAEFGVREEY